MEESEPGSREEQPVLLTAQPPRTFFLSGFEAEFCCIAQAGLALSVARFPQWSAGSACLLGRRHEGFRDDLCRSLGVGANVIVGSHQRAGRMATAWLLVTLVGPEPVSPRPGCCLSCYKPRSTLFIPGMGCCTVKSQLTDTPPPKPCRFLLSLDYV